MYFCTWLLFKLTCYQIWTVDEIYVHKDSKKLKWFNFGLCRYDERIDRVETRITAKLRDQLGTAKNANEMFRIFSRFNALFVRPHIRGAIREYQTQLIQRVKDDIEALHEKFKVYLLQTISYGGFLLIISLITKGKPKLWQVLIIITFL